MSKRPLTRSEALTELAGYGITGKAVYLLDCIPLVEMMWADGVVQSEELRLLELFLAEHIQRINQQAALEVLTVEDARAFVARFVTERPSPELLRMLRNLVRPARLSTSSVEANQKLADDILAWCLDIAAAAVRHYPYGAHERFSQSEKDCYRELSAALRPVI